MSDDRHPIVLVHGLLGFATIAGRLEYFRGVMRHLENNPQVLDGLGKVYVADLDPTDTVPSRAIQLRDFIQRRVLRDGEMRFRKVNIIAHSMGGLDARYMVAQLSMDTGPALPMSDVVASLTTIGTPHWGTPVADWLLRHTITRAILGVPRTFSIELGAFDQLTEQYLHPERDGGTDFGARMPDQPGVEYFSYAGDVPLTQLTPPFYPFAAYLSYRGVAHDGIVPVDSALFRYGALSGEYPQRLPADHGAQIGFGLPGLGIRRGSGFDHLEFYAHVANTLGQRGLYVQ